MRLGVKWNTGRNLSVPLVTRYALCKALHRVFRSLKTDLEIRPVHHQKDKNTEAHIFVSIVAYQLVHAIRRAMKQESINHCWWRIRNIMSSQTIVTMRMKLENKDSLVLRNVTRPNQELTNNVFRIYYTSRCTDQQNVDVYFEDSNGQVVQKTFSLSNETIPKEE